MSPSGAAVGFLGAKADSTGVIASVGDGSILGAGVLVGVRTIVGAHALKMSKKDRSRPDAKGSFVIREPRENWG